MGIIAHLAALNPDPLYIFDGLNIPSIKGEIVDYKLIRRWLIYRLLKSSRIVIKSQPSCSQRNNPKSDIFFQERESSNPFYDAIPHIVQSYMDEFRKDW